MKIANILVLAALLMVLPGFATGCVQDVDAKQKTQEGKTSGDIAKEISRQADYGKGQTDNAAGEKKLETITLGAGCFWCVEAVFEELKGVETVVSGYMGGTIPNPTYQQVCTGMTWHAEVCQLTYDPEQVTLPELLEVFWQTHDPTTINRQGVDAGTQYRSAIFYSTEEQKKVAEELRARLDQSRAFNAPIVTEITAASEFYPAEDYHQEYFKNNAKQPYCKSVIVPKMKKFRKVFADKLKDSEDGKKSAGTDADKDPDKDPGKDKD